MAGWRATAQLRFKFLQQHFRSLGHCFHTAVHQIPDPTFKLKLLTLPASESSVTDSLNSARNQVVFGKILHSTKVRLGTSLWKGLYG